MDARAVAKFFSRVGSTDCQRWSDDEIRLLAELRVPPEVYGEREWLLQADATLAHAKWFLEGLVDPAPYAEGVWRDRSFPHLAAMINDAIMKLKRDLPVTELRPLVEALAKVAWADISGRRRGTRVSWSRDVRDQLWDLYGPGPRCYLCGYLFAIEACERFFKRLRVSPPMPVLVDFARPRVRPRDLQIEVDHVKPLSAGGTNDEANLRLACGWCNRVKSNYGSLYDTQAWLKTTLDHPRLGWVSVPRPMWVLRVVSMRGRCEHRECGETLHTSELFAAPWSSKGALTPPNIRVFCADHDEWKSLRYVNAGLLLPRSGRSGRHETADAP